MAGTLPGMSVPTIVSARPDQKPAIANLVQLCLYDVTATMPFPVGPDGRFEYGFLDRFWQHPYLLYAGDEIAGFALVIDHCPLTATSPCWFMAEFFVLKAYRRSGIGSQDVAGIVDRHPATGMSACLWPTCRLWHSGAGLSRPDPPASRTFPLRMMPGDCRPSWSDGRPRRIGSFGSAPAQQKKARIAAGLSCFGGKFYSAASGRLTTVTPFSSFSTSPASWLTI